METIRTLATRPGHRRSRRLSRATVVGGALLLLATLAGCDRLAFTWGGTVAEFGPVATSTGWTDVDGGFRHTCALRSAELYCWGENEEGQLGIGSTDPASTPQRVGDGKTWSDVSVGSAHSCGIRAGQLYCWGANDVGQLGIGDGPGSPTPVRVGQSANWTAVTAGTGHTCAIRSPGQMWCWGANGEGQVGNGNREQQSWPTVLITASHTWTDVAAGALHTCGTRSGGLYCWGDNAFGQIADGGSSDALEPKRIGTGTTWDTVASGNYHSCARTLASDLFCWGDNGGGQVGDGTSGNVRRSPAEVGAGQQWTGPVAAGDAHSCASTTGGALWCWGVNALGQRGVVLPQQATTPVRVGSEGGWGKVGAGNAHTCGVNAGRLWCWGHNAYLQVGDGTTINRFLPVTVGPEVDWSSISTYSSITAVQRTSTCGIRSGELWCWGRNTYGQLGDGTTGTGRDHAVRVGTAEDWNVVAMGNGHACGIKADGELWCWGRNGDGQVGNGTYTDRTTPARIGGRTDWTSVATGSRHTCGVAGGVLWCWGSNVSGQVGDSTTATRNAPTAVSAPFSGWTSVSAGGDDLAGAGHTCAIRSPGELWCWGRNTSGEAGLGAVTGTVVPLRVGAASDWKQVDAGERHTCGLRGAGALWCWGYNASGQVGDGTTTQRTTPVPVGSATDWRTVTVAGTLFHGGHTCAIRGGSGQLWCWGSNLAAQFGDGTISDGSTVPVRIGTSEGWSRLDAGGGGTAGTRSR